MNIIRLLRITKYLKKHKILTTLVFIFACFLLFNSIVYGASIGSFDTKLVGYGNRDLYFTYDSSFLSYVQNSSYWNDNYYKIVFQSSNLSNRNVVNRAWFISKTDSNLNLSQYTTPFNFTINSNSSPGNTTRSITINSIGNVNVVEFWQETWSGGNSSTSYFVNDNPTYNVKFDYDNGDSWTNYYIWSDYSSLTTIFNNNSYRFSFSDFVAPSVSGLIVNDSTDLQTLNSPFNNFILHNNDVDISTSSILFDIYDDTYGVSTDPFLSLTLNNTSIYYWTNNLDKSYFTFNLSDISKYKSVNGNKYHIFINYYDNSNNTHTIAYWFQFVFSADVIQNIEDNTQQNINNNLENINNQMEQTNEFLTSDNVNDSDIELPEMEAEDFTFSFFSTAVNSIIDAMNTTTNNETISFVFRDKTYTINSSDFNFLQHNGFELLRQLLPLFWIFSIGLMIYKDAHHRIQKLKEFNWHAMFSDDISVNML